MERFVVMAKVKKQAVCPPGHIRVSDIVESKVALRGVDTQSESFLQLCESLRLHGVLNSIVVRELKDAEGKTVYGLVDGLQRWSAAKAIGLEFIPANIRNMNEADVLEAQTIANVHVIETKHAEYANALLRIIAQNPMLTLRELAQRMAKSVQWIEKRLSLVKLDENVQKLVDEGKIKLQNAYALARLPVEEQVNFVDRAMVDEPKEFVPVAVARAKELASAKRQGRDPAKADFQPVESLKKMSVIKEAAKDSKTAAAICEKNDCKTAIDGFLAAMRWVLNVDVDGLAAQKQKYEEREAKKAADKKKRDEERAAKKAAEASEKKSELEEALGL